MNTVFENFDSVTGWTASTGAVVYGVNDIKDFIAGDLSHSLIVGFNATGCYVTKIYSPAISTVGYKELTLHVWSRLKGADDNEKYTDFVYKIDFGSGKEYYFPVHTTFTDVTIDISDITTIDRIRITSLHDDLDYLVISYGVLSVDEMPYDIFVGLQTQINKYITENYSTKYLVGSLTSLTVGDLSITFASSPSWIARYAKIMITDGTHTEYHVIDKHDRNTFYFNDLYGGTSLLYSYTTANVYISFACEFGKYETEIILPSIVLMGMIAENMQIDSDIQHDLDTWKSDHTVNDSMTGKWFKHMMMIDCESWNVELMSEASSIVKKVLGQLYFWVNGKKCHIQYDGVPAFIEPNDIANNLPKVQYTVSALIKESTWDKVRLPVLATTVNTVSIQ